MKFEFSQEQKDYFVAANAAVEARYYHTAEELALRAIHDRDEWMSAKFYDDGEIAIVRQGETVPHYVVRVEPDGEGYTVSTIDPEDWAYDRAAFYGDTEYADLLD